MHAMSQATIGNVWSAAAVVLLYFSLNAWSLTQQWQLSLPGDPFREGKFTPHGVTLVAIPVAGALLAFTAVLVRLYAARSGRSGWAARFPRFSGIAIDVSKREGRWFQGASLGVLLLLPVAAQIHFTWKFLDGSAYLGERKLWSGLAHLVNYVPFADALSGRYSYDRFEQVAPSFAPFWEPWLFILFEVGVLSVVGLCLREVFASSPQRGRD
jgi:hypothetical protein